MVGNGLALARPPQRRAAEADLDRAPLARSLLMMGVGLVVVAWILATLLS